MYYKPTIFACMQNQYFSVADLGFPRGGGANPPGKGVADKRFCQIFPKTAWNWKNLDPKEGARVFRAPLRSANDSDNLLLPGDT